MIDNRGAIPADEMVSAEVDAADKTMRLIRDAHRDLLFRVIRSYDDKEACGAPNKQVVEISRSSDERIVPYDFFFFSIVYGLFPGGLKLVHCRVVSDGGDGGPWAAAGQSGDQVSVREKFGPMSQDCG